MGENENDLISKMINDFTQNREASDHVRYAFEHRMLPMLVEQDEDGKFIKSLLELQGQILYHLMSELCQVKGIEMPYSPNDYDVTRTQVSDDKFFVTLTMPEPLKMPHCRRVYILLNNDFSQKKYITVEKDMFTTDFMCGWDMSDGQVKHNNYGPSPENIQDEIEKVKTLFGINRK